MSFASEYLKRLKYLVNLGPRLSPHTWRQFFFVYRPTLDLCATRRGAERRKHAPIGFIRVGAACLWGQIVSFLVKEALQGWGFFGPRKEPFLWSGSPRRRQSFPSRSEWTSFLARQDSSPWILSPWYLLTREVVFVWVRAGMACSGRTRFRSASLSVHRSSRRSGWNSFGSNLQHYAFIHRLIVVIQAFIFP